MLLKNDVYIYHTIPKDRPCTTMAPIPRHAVLEQRKVCTAPRGRVWDAEEMCDASLSLSLLARALL